MLFGIIGSGVSTCAIESLSWFLGKYHSKDVYKENYEVFCRYLQAPLPVAPTPNLMDFNEKQAGQITMPQAEGKNLI